MDYRDYIQGMKKKWIGRKVGFEGRIYTVVDVDYNGALLINKKAQFTDTTAIAETMVESVKDIDKNAYYRTRTHFEPEERMVYENEGGGEYKCIESDGTTAWFRNISSGWTFIAHGVGIYCDGKIDWQYSTNGSFERR